MNSIVKIFLNFLYFVFKVTAYAESPWSPDKGKVNNNDMQWGGGSIVVWENEKKSKDGGKRKLTYR